MQILGAFSLKFAFWVTRDTLGGVICYLIERQKMYKLFNALFGTLFAFGTQCVFAEDAPLLPQSSRAEYVLQKVAEADVACAKALPSVNIEVNAFGVRSIKERPIILCAFSEATKTWHIITLALRYPVSPEYISCVKSALSLLDRKSCVLPVRTITEGYRIEHLRGYGITRFIVNAYHGDEKLTVYRTRHIWFDDDALASKDVDRIVATSRTVSYTPFHPDFEDTELVDTGMQFLFQKIRTVQSELGFDIARDATVRSLAFPLRSLSDVVPWQIPMALAVIEQMDDKTFLADRVLATEAVFVEYALNRDDTFQWAQSGANAIGALQFTNGNGNGTYTSVVERCRGANLNPNFDVGARDLGNVLKAAICLIDIEVAQFPSIKPVYERSPKLAGIYPVAAYNGGPPAAQKMYAWIKRRGIDVEREEIEVPTAFVGTRIQKCPCKNATQGKGKRKRNVEHMVIRVENTETPGYVAKYISLLNYLADKGLE
jgi:hypothetical protein